MSLMGILLLGDTGGCSTTISISSYVDDGDENGMIGDASSTIGCGFVKYNPIFLVIVYPFRNLVRIILKVFIFYTIK